MIDAILREDVVVTVNEQSPMSAYLARPAAPGPYAAVIIGMELFGVTRHIRNITDRVAALGYLAIAPDFYHRSEAGVVLPYDQTGRDKGFALLHRLSRDDALQDVAATLHYLRQRPEGRGQVGFLGFSVGGHIGYLAATQLDLAASAIFYAGWLTNTQIELSQPDPTLTLTPGIANNGGRLIYFVGEQDFLIPAEQRGAITAALAQAAVDYEMIVYPDVGHGFFCDERDSYDAPAHDDAWERVRELFASALSARKQ